MNCQTWRVPMLVLLAGPPTVRAEGGGWAEGLARLVSGRIPALEQELSAIERELPALPDVPVADQGGTGGFARLYPKDRPGAEGAFAVEIRCAEPGMVSTVALVPARRYGVRGLESQFGMPDAFRVELIDDSGAVVALVAEEKNLWAHPARDGHPFFYEVEPPVLAAGMRVSASRLRRDPDVEDNHVHAWAEAFLFEGNRNLATGGTVSCEEGSSPAAPWHWANAFLIDGQTPLGLPEIPAGEHRNVGWMSEGRPKATDAAWLEMDLLESKNLDAVRLFPAKRPTSDLPSGFGFPRRFTIIVLERDPAAGTETRVAERTVEMANPGHNPVRVPLEACRGRYIRLEATELWKAFKDYPAFLALSELEVLEGEDNQALGAIVRSTDGIGNIIGYGMQYWNAASLSDGFGPDGRLVPHREWLGQLNQRLALETRRHSLRQEREGIINDWRRMTVATFGTLGGAATLLLIALPIRYRLRSRRELARVRERIAGDLHDEVGSNLGSIQMLADLAEGHRDPTKELKRIQRIAAETVSAVRDIVWLLRPQGDHRIGTVEHLRETGSIMIDPLDWEFSANEAAWQCELSDEANRHLFLFFREALHNALRHSGATRVDVRVEEAGGRFCLSVADDGGGIPPDRLARPSTLRALRQRAEALSAEFQVDSAPGAGTRLKLEIPLPGTLRKPLRKRPAGP
jgi:signal transduction histidine kinase